MKLVEISTVDASDSLDSLHLQTLCGNASRRDRANIEAEVYPVLLI